MHLARCPGRHRKIVDVAGRSRARPWITGKLVDRCEHDSPVVHDDVFRSVAVMRVEIPDRDTFRAVLERIERRDRDVAEVTETHRAFAHGVMTGRPHQAERLFFLTCRVRHFERSAGRAQGMLINLSVDWRIGIEGRGGRANSFHVLRGMGSQKRCFARRFRFAPFPIVMALPQ